MQVLDVDGIERNCFNETIRRNSESNDDHEKTVTDSIEHVFLSNVFATFLWFLIVYDRVFARTVFHGGVFQSSGSRLVTNGLARLTKILEGLCLCILITYYRC